MKEPIYDLTEEQAQFRDVIEAYLRKSYTEEKRREIILSSQGMSFEVWRELADDIGVFGLGFGVVDGGYDGSAIAQIPIMEAFGQMLVLEPYVETVVLAGTLLARANGPRAAVLIGQVISGGLRLALAHAEEAHWSCPQQINARAILSGEGFRLSGRKPVVVAAPWADTLLVVAKMERSGIAIFEVPVATPGLRLHCFATIDGRQAADIEIEDVNVPSNALLLCGDDANNALDAAYMRSTVAICAESVGIQRRLVADTRRHLDERRQFGVPLATFQVLQHRMADMLIALETSIAMVYRAASALDAGSDDRQKIVSATKAHVGRAVHRCAQAAVQMHGGMGLTDELLIGQLFKRAIAIEGQFGSTGYHIRRFQALDRERAVS
jgi:alkylation response protein AidB-like acyl-CoA dehydrogenase